MSALGVSLGVTLVLAGGALWMALRAPSFLGDEPWAEKPEEGEER